MNSFTFLVKSKPVKQEVSRKVMLPPMASVLYFQYMTSPSYYHYQPSVNLTSTHFQMANASFSRNASSIARNADTTNASPSEWIQNGYWRMRRRESGSKTTSRRRTSKHRRRHRRQRPKRQVGRSRDDGTVDIDKNQPNPDQLTKELRQPGPILCYNGSLPT